MTLLPASALLTQQTPTGGAVSLQAKAQTMPLMVSAMSGTRGTEWWYMSVVILVMILPVIFLAIVLERYIQRGLLMGAVKG